MKTQKIYAFVLRQRPLRESDMVVVFYARGLGLKEAAARGIKRTVSRFGGRLEPFNLVEAELYRGKNLDTVTQGEALKVYGPTLLERPGTYEAASSLVDILEAVRYSREIDRQFLLFHGALDALARGKISPRCIRDSFTLRSLSLSGWSPVLAECLKCGVRDQPLGFSPRLGGAICSECSPEITPLPGDVWLQLKALSLGEWAAVLNEGPTARAASDLVYSFARWHLDAALRTFRLDYGS